MRHKYEYHYSFIEVEGRDLNKNKSGVAGDNEVVSNCEVCLKCHAIRATA